MVMLARVLRRSIELEVLPACEYLHIQKCVVHTHRLPGLTAPTRSLSPSSSPTCSTVLPRADRWNGPTETERERGRRREVDRLRVLPLLLADADFAALPAPPLPYVFYRTHARQPPCASRHTEELRTRAFRAASWRAAITMRSYSASASAWSDTSAAVRVCRPSDEKALAARAIDVERMLPAPPRPVYFVCCMYRVSRCKSETALCGALTVSDLIAGGSRPRVMETSSLL